MKKSPFAVEPRETTHFLAQSFCGPEEDPVCRGFTRMSRLPPSPHASPLAAGGASRSGSAIGGLSHVASSGQRGADWMQGGRQEPGADAFDRSRSCPVVGGVVTPQRSALPSVEGRLSGRGGSPDNMLQQMSVDRIRKCVRAGVMERREKLHVKNHDAGSCWFGANLVPVQRCTSLTQKETCVPRVKRKAAPLLEPIDWQPRTLRISGQGAPPRLDLQQKPGIDRWLPAGLMHMNLAAPPTSPHFSVEPRPGQRVDMHSLVWNAHVDPDLTLAEVSAALRATTSRDRKLFDAHELTTTIKCEGKGMRSSLSFYSWVFEKESSQPRPVMLLGEMQKEDCRHGLKEFAQYSQTPHFLLASYSTRKALCAGYIARGGRFERGADPQRRCSSAEPRRNEKCSCRSILLWEIDFARCPMREERLARMRKQERAMWLHQYADYTVRKGSLAYLDLAPGAHRSAGESEEKARQLLARESKNPSRAVSAQPAMETTASGDEMTAALDAVERRGEEAEWEGEEQRKAKEKTKEEQDGQKQNQASSREQNALFAADMKEQRKEAEAGKENEQERECGTTSDRVSENEKERKKTDERTSTGEEEIRKKERERLEAENQDQEKELETRLQWDGDAEERGGAGARAGGEQGDGKAGSELQRREEETMKRFQDGKEDELDRARSPGVASDASQQLQQPQVPVQESKLTRDVEAVRAASRKSGLAKMNKALFKVRLVNRIAGVIDEIQVDLHTASQLRANAYTVLSSPTTLMARRRQSQREEEQRRHLEEQERLAREAEQDLFLRLESAPVDRTDVCSDAFQRFSPAGQDHVNKEDDERAALRALVLGMRTSILRARRSTPFC